MGMNFTSMLKGQMYGTQCSNIIGHSLASAILYLAFSFLPRHKAGAKTRS